MCLKGGKHFHASEVSELSCAFWLTWASMAARGRLGWACVERVGPYCILRSFQSLDVMPLTKPEQFGAPVLGRRKGGRRRRAAATTATTTATMGTASDTTSSSDEDEIDPTSSTRCADIDDPASGAESESKRSRAQSSPYVGSQSSDYGRVVCVYEQAATSDSRRWFPALIVSPDMRKNLKINTNEEYLVRSFKDGKW